MAITLNKEWIPREKWNALVRGEDCPLCAEVAAKEASNEHGYYVTDLDFSQLRLCNNQYVKGYCVIICHKHVREPYELSQEDCQKYFKDMMRAGLALEKVFGADKMNFQILGNIVPHLHCHLEPRYLGDPAPNSPIDPNTEEVILTPEEYKERIEKIIRALVNF